MAATNDLTANEELDYEYEPDSESVCSTRPGSPESVIHMPSCSPPLIELSDDENNDDDTPKRLRRELIYYDKVQTKPYQKRKWKLRPSMYSIKRWRIRALDGCFVKVPPVKPVNTNGKSRYKNQYRCPREDTSIAVNNELCSLPTFDEKKIDFSRPLETERQDWKPPCNDFKPPFQPPKRNETRRVIVPDQSSFTITLTQS